jgi:hypothetical protein
MQPGPAPFDPYRAGAAAGGFAPLRSGPSTLLSVVVSLALLCFFGSVGLFTAAIIVDVNHPNDTLGLAGSGMLVTCILLLYAQIGTGVWWVHRAWSWLPSDQRYTRHWKSWITPGTAVGFLFIPYFHYYWMFVINCGICDALDRLRVSYPTKRAAPKQLAIAAGICQMLIPLPVGSILWVLFARRVEAMTQEMAASSAPKRIHANRANYGSGSGSRANQIAA